MTAEHHHLEHQKLVEELWEATGGDNPLRGFRNFQELIDSIPYKKRLVETIEGAQIYLVCIDERLVGSGSLVPNAANYVRMAGEGILNPNAEEDIKRAGINGIIAHRHCGAKGIHAANRDAEGHPDDIGFSAVRELADRVGIPVV